MPKTKPAPSITLTASSLAALVKPVLPFAAQDGELPVLNAVLIQTQGAFLTATATDRYRLAIQRLAYLDKDAPPFSLLVALRDLRQILGLFKATRKDDRELTITIDGDGKFTVTASGALDGFLAAKMAWRCIDGQYPRIRKLLRDALAQKDQLPAIHVNPHYLADFAGAAPRHVPMRVWGSDPAQPLAIAIGEDFVAALMPIRTAEQRYDPDSWTPLLGTDETKDEAAA